LSSPCTVASQIDVIKYMLQNPIMSDIIDKWSYALIKYNLAYESLKSMYEPLKSMKDIIRSFDGTFRLYGSETCEDIIRFFDEFNI
jgi:hypothetical protein